MIYVLLAFQLALIFEMRRRLKGFNPPEAASWFLFVSEIVYIFGDFFTQNDQGSMGWSTFSYLHHPEHLILYYTCVVMMFAASTLGVGRLNTSVQELREAMMAIMARVAALEPMLAGMILTFIIAHMVIIRWDILLSNQSYLLIGSFEATKVSRSLGSIIQSLVSASSLISAVFFAISSSRNFRPFTLLWAALFGWQLSLQIASCSRTCAVLVGIFVMVSSLFSPRPRPIRQTILGLFAVWLYCAALSGRGEGQFGLTAIPEIIASPVKAGFGQILTVLASICQGAFVTGDGLDYTAQFNPIYTALSFSPLPSVIDHFNLYLDIYQIRLSEFVPMGAQTEVIFFGPVWTALFWGTIFFLCRTLVKNKKYVGVFYYFGSMLFLVTFMQSGAYPTRNVYRFFFILLVFGVMLANRTRNRIEQAFRLREAQRLEARMREIRLHQDRLHEARRQNAQ